MTVTRTAPKAVRYAALAAWAILVLVVLRVILTLALSDDLLDAWIESDTSSQGLPREVAEERAPAYVPIALGVLVVGVVLAAAVAAFLSKGARWARIVSIVFASLTLVGAVLSLLAPTIAVLLVVHVLVGLLSLVVIVLLGTSEARRFLAR